MSERQIHRSHLAKTVAQRGLQHDQGLQVLCAALPACASPHCPSHPTELCRAHFPNTAREWQPRGVGIPSTSTAKNRVPVQGTLLADSGCPSDLLRDAGAAGREVIPSWMLPPHGFLPPLLHMRRVWRLTLQLSCTIPSLVYEDQVWGLRQVCNTREAAAGCSCL